MKRMDSHMDYGYILKRMDIDNGYLPMDIDVWILRPEH